MASEVWYDASQFPRRVLWMRGAGCRELAELLATERAIQATDDPQDAGVRHRVDMVVMKSVGSLDLLPVAAPDDFEADRVGEVIAAVAEGPHSAFAAVIAGRLGSALGVEAEAVNVVLPGAPRADARRTLDRARAVADIPGRVVEAKSAAHLLASVDPAALLVLGAPGGSWLHRQFFGPGARLRARAPGGTIVVRSAPVRAFQHMTDPTGVGPHLRVADALALPGGAVLPVLDEGDLVGIVRRGAMRDADPEIAVSAVMEEPAIVEAIDAVADLAPLLDFYERSPIPLVDRRGRLVGMLDPEHVPAGS